MTSEEADQGTRTWREELPRLFGIKWDSFALWLIFGWASLWLWTSWVVSNRMTLPQTGPISWIAEMLNTVDIATPNWLVDILDWLAYPSHAWLLPLLIAMSAAFATLAVRGDFKGLRFVALLSMLLALEIDQSGWPLLWAGLVALAPALIALGWGIVHSHWHTESNEYSYYYPPRVVRDFLGISIGLYAFPVIAPFVFIYALIASYRTDVPLKAHEDLARAALRELDVQRRAGSKPDQLTRLSLLAAIIAAPSSSRSDIALQFHLRLKDRQESRRLEREMNNQLRFEDSFKR